MCELTDHDRLRPFVDLRSDNEQLAATEAGKSAGNSRLDRRIHSAKIHQGCLTRRILFVSGVTFSWLVVIAGAVGTREYFIQRSITQLAFAEIDELAEPMISNNFRIRGAAHERFWDLCFEYRWGSNRPSPPPAFADTVLNRIMPAMIEMCESSSTARRCDALMVLCRISEVFANDRVGNEASLDVLINGTQELESTTRAVGFFGWRAKSVIPILATRLQRPHDFVVGRAAVDALAQIAENRMQLISEAIPEQGKPAEYETEAEQEHRERIHELEVAVAVARFDGQEAHQLRDSLCAATLHADPYVRCQAVRALRCMWDCASQTSLTLIARVEDSDQAVREHAWRTLRYPAFKQEAVEMRSRLKEVCLAEANEDVKSAAERSLRAIEHLARVNDGSALPAPGPDADSDDFESGDELELRSIKELFGRLNDMFDDSSENDPAGVLIEVLELRGGGGR